MNHSLLSADRTTHLKIVVLALVAGIVVVTVGITARLAETGLTTARIEAGAPVVKAGKPATFTGRETSTIR